MAAAYGIGQNDATITVTWNDDQTRKGYVAGEVAHDKRNQCGHKKQMEYRHDFTARTMRHGKSEDVPGPNTPDPFNFGA